MYVYIHIYILRPEIQGFLFQSLHNEDLWMSSASVSSQKFLKDFKPNREADGVSFLGDTAGVYHPQVIAILMGGIDWYRLVNHPQSC